MSNAKSLLSTLLITSSPVALLSCEAALDCGDDVPLFAWPDADRDGHGVAGPATLVCPNTPGWSLTQLDCDDNDPTIHPDAREQCDLIDHNCNGVDDDTLELTRWRLDRDGDGYGALEGAILSCARPDVDEPLVPIAGDCDDSNPDLHPDAPEVCNGLDDNCNGLVDDEDPLIDTTTRSVWFLDEDRDGFAPIAGSELRLLACSQPPSSLEGDWSVILADCDDTNPRTSPAETEIPNNGLDDDCDGLIDEFA